LTNTRSSPVGTTGRRTRGTGGCPLSVREKAPAHAESNQELAGNVERVGAVKVRTVLTRAIGDLAELLRQDVA
jgi:hypothetical protein